MNKYVIAIDASRNRSGGARAHLIGILTNCEPSKHNIKEVHVWSFRGLLNQIPNYPWLIKHNPIELEQSLLKQLWWQGTKFSEEIKSAKCDILFTTDASSLCLFKPMVALSQDMLSYEPGVMSYFGYSLTRLRLLTILVLQNLAFRRANGVIFLTQYAGTVIQKSCGLLPNLAYIPHGVDEKFRQSTNRVKWPDNDERPINCVYVSNTEMYKHQWIVVKAFSILRKQGYNLKLKLVGGGEGPAQKLLQDEIAIADPNNVFVEQFEFLPHKELPTLLAESDLFIFASSCENMPVTLIEAMAIGLPIACSNRGPMPEVLANAGVYFDPEDPKSISAAIENIIQSPQLRLDISKKAILSAKEYTWERCSFETMNFISDTYIKSKLPDNNHL